MWCLVRCVHCSPGESRKPESVSPILAAHILGLFLRKAGNPTASALLFIFTPDHVFFRTFPFLKYATISLFQGEVCMSSLVPSPVVIIQRNDKI